MTPYTFFNTLLGRSTSLPKTAEITPNKTTARSDGYSSKIAPKAQSITRRDIASWQSALRAAVNIDNPRRARLQNLYSDIMLDAHLTSQYELRKQKMFSTPGVLKRDGEVDQQYTDLISNSQWRAKLDSYAFDSELFGPTVIEFVTDKSGNLDVMLIPRTNVVPEQGLILLKEDDTKGIEYRNVREYGTWLLEFGNPTNLGLLNKAIPHVLFKKFAQACWSELCEIYGIPPRVLKTNTQDPEMLARAEAMMRDMGSASWWLIDTDENFEFAQGVATNGDVYKNLINLCQNEISLLINGAIVGQDTVNGNRSKEEVSIGLVDTIGDADKRRMEGYWNGIILPALVRIGVLPEGLRYEYQPQENTEKLFNQTHKVLQYMDVDPAWIKDKFGIEVTGVRKNATPTSLNVGDFFE